MGSKILRKSGRKPDDDYKRIAFSDLVRDHICKSRTGRDTLKIHEDVLAAVVVNKP